MSSGICADCSAPNPTWASINRGVFVCDECCSIHRGLGRHISYIRSLHSNSWPPVLKETVYTLVNKGANSIWEHALHDGHSKVKIKKPGMRDKPHPTKYEFIVAKYKLLLLLPKLSHKDNPNYMEDLCKQLHASVRTSNLETCLRLLSLGANPNYVHPDRGNTPLHVAAQAGQAMQVELLCVYGANPCLLDRLGHTPEECARIAGHHQLADRLIESQYELTDKLSFFLCGRKPVHSIGEHYLVPQVSGSGLNLGLTEARSRLQELSNDLFEQLAADVYDEVDRRETDALWLTTQQLQSSVAFLPVNPTLSPLRNQGRQKLATLDAQEFAQLVVDILVDTKRRQMISLETGQKSGTVVPSTSDDQPPGCYDPHDYDEVPVEEMTRSPPPSNGGYSTIRELEDVCEEGEQLPEYAEVRASHPGPASGPTPDPAELNVIQGQLKEVQVKKEKLEEVNESLQKKLMDMQQQLNKVIEENSQLRTSAKSPTSPTAAATPTSPPPPPPTGQTTSDEPQPEYAQVDKSKKIGRRSGGSRPPSNPQSIPSPRHSGHTPTKLLSPKRSSDALTPPPGRVDTPPVRQDTPLSDSPFEEPSSEPAGKKAGPSLDVIHLHIKKLTHCIQELLQAAQGQRQSSFPPCSLKIMRSVEAMTQLFPTAATSQEVQVSLREVVLAAKHLQGECRVSGHSDLAFRTRHIINSAYDVAKAARHLVMCVEQEKEQ